MMLRSMILFAGLLMAGCAGMAPVTDAMKPSKPEVTVAGVTVTGLSFDQADLEFTLDVRNDNPFGLDLASLDYDFQVAGQSLVKGTQEKTGKLRSNAVSQVRLPVSLSYRDLREIGAALTEQDSVDYRLSGRLGVDLPVLGLQTVPLNQAGSLPVPKMPRVRLVGLALGEVGLTAAEVRLKVEVENPNAFDLDVRGLNFDLAVNDQPWGSANLSDNLKVAQKSKAELLIPMNLAFSQIGQSGFQLLVRRELFDYRLSGDVRIDTSLPLLRDLQVPFDFAGRGLSL